MICTSIEQSKMLLESGIDPDTADMYWRELIYSDPKRYRANVREDGMMIESPVVAFSAWSLTALLELIPESIDDYTDNFSQLEITKKSISYVYADGRLRIGYLKSNLLDAAFEMVYWLLTNKLLTI